MHRDFLDRILPENEDTLALASHFMGGQEASAHLMLERLREIAVEDEYSWLRRGDEHASATKDCWPEFDFAGLGYKSANGYLTNYGWLLGDDCWIVDFNFGARYQIGSEKLEYALARGVVAASLAMQMRSSGRTNLKTFMAEWLGDAAACDEGR